MMVDQRGGLVSTRVVGLSTRNFESHQWTKPSKSFVTIVTLGKELLEYALTRTIVIMKKPLEKPSTLGTPSFEE
jgi:hypothetical protein